VLRSLDSSWPEDHETRSRDGPLGTLGRVHGGPGVLGPPGILGEMASI